MGLAWTVCLGVLPALVACGGGGGGDAVPTAPPFAETAARYWVSGDSGSPARWVYQRVDGRAGHDATPVLKTVVDAGAQTQNGTVYRRFEHSLSLFDDAPETEYRRFDGRSIQALADLAGEFGLSLPARVYAEAPAPLVDGATTVVADETEHADFNGDGIADTLHIVARVNTARAAALSVPAGDFSDLLLLHTVITGTATDGASGQETMASATLSAWYAPGVGIVRRRFEDPGYAAPANTVTEELVGLDAGGLRAGLLPDETLLDGIGAGTDSSTPAGTAVAVGGGQVLALATEAGRLHAALHGPDGRLVWRGTALQAPDGSEWAAVTASFDGTDFRIVATHRRPYDSPAQAVVVAQRLRIDGSLRDGLAGVALQTGVPDATQTLTALRSAAKDGRLLLAWGRYDTTYVPVGPGLVTQRGYVIEARLFGASHEPVAGPAELAGGLPAAVGLRDDQFMLIGAPQDGGIATTLAVHVLSAVDGLPTATSPVVVDERLRQRVAPAFQTVGSDLWLSCSNRDPAAPDAAALTAMRLGRDGVLLDGTTSAPGQVLVTGDASSKAGGQLALGDVDHLLSWVEGWNNVKAVNFRSPVLDGTAPLPTTVLPLSMGGEAGVAGPSRHLLWSGAAGGAPGSLLVAWLDNQQTASTPSDRIVATWRLPRVVAP
ncbi:MAG: hypothetical protein H6933_06275 [Burkholderiaceae bacterium]|nr:hypothetical protein [Rhodoferax sp.]MCP5284486.1 hypothetical protein [Burkholderiaceae bacterium]